MKHINTLIMGKKMWEKYFSKKILKDNNYINNSNIYFNNCTILESNKV